MRMRRWTKGIGFFASFRMYYNNCCVCKASRQDVILHRFPNTKKSEKRLNKWLRCINRDDLKQLSLKHFSKLFVCEKHFERRFFTTKSRLICVAYPSLFTEDEISSGIPSQENDGNTDLQVEHNYSFKTLFDHTYCMEPLRAEIAAARKCCVPNCGVTDEILHSFPNPEKQLDQFREWTSKVGGDIVGEENLHIFQYYRVCHLHFEDKYHTRNKMLSHNAVPTLKLSGSQAPVKRDHLKYDPENPVTISPAASMDESHHTDDALADVPDVEVVTEEKSLIISVEEHILNVRSQRDICRTCLHKGHPRYTVSLFTVDKSTGRSYNHMMHSTIGIQAVQNDNFPTSLCRMCKQTVLRCYNFQLQAKKANRILQSKTRSHNFGARVKDEHSQSQENTQLDNDTHFMDYEQCDNSDFETADADIKKPKPELIPNQCRSCLKSFNNALELLQHIRSNHHNLIANKTERSNTKLATSGVKAKKSDHRNLIANTSVRSNAKLANCGAQAIKKIGEIKSEKVTSATDAVRSIQRAVRRSRESGTPRAAQKQRESGTPRAAQKPRDSGTPRASQKPRESGTPRAAQKPRERGTLRVAQKPRKRGTLRAAQKPRERGTLEPWIPREGERCNVCGDVFPDTDTLSEHCSRHGETEVIMCALCERVYLKYSQFKRHFTVYHPDMELINQTENTATIVEMKDAAAMQEILQHVRLTSIGDLITANLPPSDEPAVVDAFVHTCGLCGCIILSPEGVELHNQTEHPDYATRCCYCGMHFSKTTYLTFHQNNCKNTPMKYECLPCGQRFYSESGLRKHGSTVHSHMQQVCEEGGGAEGEQDADDNKTCEMCGTVFRLISSLRRHRTTWCCHGPRPLFKCDHCEKVYKTRHSLREHMSVHNSAIKRVRKYLCSWCGKTFSRKAQMIIHVRCHTGETPFVCSVCQKGFKTDHEFKYHQWRHSGTFRYKCEHCGKGFPRNPSLQRHMMIHTGERPHKCNQCDAAFIQKTCLLAHMKKHLPSYDESLILNPEPFKKIEASDSPTAEEISPYGHWEEGFSSKRARTGSARVKANSSSQKKTRSKKGKSNPLILYDSDD